MGRARTLIRWITGAALPPEPADPNGFVGWPRSSWQVRLTSPGHGLVVPHATAPNALHRAAQRWLLGIRWEMLQ